METGPQLKVSSDRQAKPGVEPANPVLQGQWLNHYTAVAPLCTRKPDKIKNIHTIIEISNNVVCTTSKPQISLRTCAVWSEPLLVAWIFLTVSYWPNIILSLRLHRLVWVYSCQMPHCWKSHAAAHIVPLHQIRWQLNCHCSFCSLSTAKSYVLFDCTEPENYYNNNR